MWQAARSLIFVLSFSRPYEGEAATKQMSQTGCLSPLGRSHTYGNCLYLPLDVWMDMQGGSEVHLRKKRERKASRQPRSDNLPPQLTQSAAGARKIHVQTPTGSPQQGQEKKKQKRGKRGQLCGSRWFQSAPLFLVPAPRARGQGN